MDFIFKYKLIIKNRVNTKIYLSQYKLIEIYLIFKDNYLVLLFVTLYQLREYNDTHHQ